MPAPNRVGTAHACVTSVARLLAARTPGMPKALALPGRTDDLTAACTHKIIFMCER